MNTNVVFTREQALQSAFAFASIQNDEPCCLSSRYTDGLFHFIVSTLYLRYEFYVDAESGEVLGIDTEPLPYEEEHALLHGGEMLSSVA